MNSLKNQQINSYCVALAIYFGKYISFTFTTL